MPRKVGMVLGRFQPLTQGHMELMKTAYDENDVIIICIGSAQYSRPFSISERISAVKDELAKRKFNLAKIVGIIPVDDIHNMPMWGKYLWEKASLHEEDINTLYVGENLPQDYKQSLIDAGLKLRALERGNFEYKDPRGKVHTVTCATDIRKLAEKEGFRLEPNSAALTKVNRFHFL